jgi:hypothetical protein
MIFIPSEKYPTQYDENSCAIINIYKAIDILKMQNLSEIFEVKNDIKLERQINNSNDDIKNIVVYEYEPQPTKISQNPKLLPSKWINSKGEERSQDYVKDKYFINVDYNLIKKTKEIEYNTKPISFVMKYLEKLNDSKDNSYSK